MYVFDLPKIRAVKTVVPEELSTDCVSAKVVSAVKNALIRALEIEVCKFWSSIMNFRIFFLIKHAASLPPWPSNTCHKMELRLHMLHGMLHAIVLSFDLLTYPIEGALV